MSENPDEEVLYLYGYKTGSQHDDISRLHPNLLERLGPSLIPIAEASCGRLVVLCVDAGHQGVYYRDEDEVTDEPFSGLFPVAESVSEFLSILHD